MVIMWYTPRFILGYGVQYEGSGCNVLIKYFSYLKPVSSRKAIGHGELRIIQILKWNFESCNVITIVLAAQVPVIIM